MATRPTLAVLALVGCLSAACSSPASSASTPGTPGPTGPSGSSVVVQVSPTTARAAPGGSVPFTATVSGTTNALVSWTVREGAAGGAVDAAGLYVAPASTGIFHVVATSRADTAASATAEVVVALPGQLVVLPPSASVYACLSVAFSASGGGGGVTWSIREGVAGGTIDASGVYRAPAVAGTYHVVAASGGSTTEAAVTVGPEKVLSLSVAPAAPTVQTGGTLSLAATVTTTCGTFAAQ